MKNRDDSEEKPSLTLDPSESALMDISDNNGTPDAGPRPASPSSSMRYSPSGSASPPRSPPLRSENLKPGFGDYLEASGRFRAYDKTTYGRRAPLGNTPGFDLNKAFPTGRPFYERQPTPSTIAPGSPRLTRFPSINPLNNVDEVGDHAQFHPVSPGSSIASLDNQVFQLSIRSASPALSAGSYNAEERPILDYDQDRHFYENILDDNDFDDFEPLELQHDHPPNLDHHALDFADLDEDEEQDTDTDNEEEEEHNPLLEEPGVRLNDPAADPAEEPNAEGPDAVELGAALRQPRRLTNIYIRTFIESAFNGATRKTTRNTLLSHKLALEAAEDTGELPQALIDCMPQMAQTLRALERRLGLDIDEFIQVFTLCKKCGTRYSEEQIENAQDAGCSQDWDDARCDEPLFQETRLYGNVRKRAPFKSFPYVSLLCLLESLLMRPGMRELMQHWQRNEDPDDVQPRTEDGWMRAMGPDRKFGDVSQGWGWWAEPVGMTRTWDPESESYGDEVGEDGPVSLASRPLGLSLALNHDG